MTKVNEFKKEIAGMETKALKEKLDTLISDLAEQKMKLKMEALKEIHTIKQTRRQIARIKHVLANQK